jgi:hypothetical protein
MNSTKRSLKKKAEKIPHVCLRPFLRVLSVSYLDSLIPDPAFLADYQSGSGSRVFMTKNWRKKFTTGKNLIFF